ncbi:MAG TPA: sugar ABC transporter substrate-binding protein [Mycobacteriales bacterium]|nr:sugar ABC transporter substrate-binding protein [Mycobacteriales bacterium]
MRKARLLTGVAAAALLLAACSDSNKVDNNTPSNNTNTNANAGTTNKANLTFAVITHGSAGDKFWDVVKAGAEKAGSDLGIKVTYQSDGSAEKQSQLIDTAVSQKVSGLVVSMADPAALKASVEKAVAAGIPVITINSGEGSSAAFGAITHVGQSETVAGQGAGTALKNAGVKHLLCVVHEAGNIGLEQRCNGAKSTLGGTVTNLQVDVSNLADASSKIKAKLQADKSVDGVLTLNNGVAIAARDAIRDANSTAKLATFDLDATVIDAIKAGQILFAIDQQQYLQGYLPITLLYLYKTNLNIAGGGQPVLTGPGFVTKDNADQIATLAGQGTR